jgi:hypothetical protein
MTQARMHVCLELGVVTAGVREIPSSRNGGYPADEKHGNRGSSEMAHPNFPFDWR